MPALPQPPQRVSAIPPPEPIKQPLAQVMPRPLTHQQQRVRPTRPDSHRPEPVATTPRSVPSPVSQSVMSVRSVVPAPLAPAGAQVLQMRKPVYPPRAQALGIEGDIRITFSVDQTGTISQLKIVSATPRNVFEQAVIKAVKSWRYQADKPLSHLSMTIRFRLNGGTEIE